MTTVSVIIPTWNRESTIKRAVLSALHQAHYITEVLVCDDGSTDNSKKIISEIKDERVKWIEGTRAGMPSVPRNRGIKASTGEWLAFLDSDDEWLPDKIFKQIVIAEKSEALAVCSNANRIKENEPLPTPYLQYANAKISFNELLGTNFVMCSTAIIKRSLIESVKGFPELPDLKALEDYALWLRVATQTDFAYLNEPLINYYDNPSESLRSEDFGIWEQKKRVFSDFILWAENANMKNTSCYSLAKKAYTKATKMTNTGLFSFFMKRI